VDYVVKKPAAGSLNFSLACTSASGCAAPTTQPSVDVQAVGLLVSDTAPPSGNVGVNAPVQDEMRFSPFVRDDGVGIDRVVVTVDERPTVPADRSAARTYDQPFGSCADLTPNTSRVDRPLDGDRCLGAIVQPIPSTPQKDNRPFVATSDLGTPTGKTYYRTVTIYDAAGNGKVILGTQNGDGTVTGEPFDIWHPPLGSSTATLSIGSSALFLPEPSQPGSNRPGGVQGASRNSCRTPRLTVVLATKPLRITKGIPVLKYKKKYRFKGRLTCVINGRRRSAPKLTKVGILNKVGKRTVTKPGTRIRSKGAMNVLLSFTSSRTVIFRFTSSERQRSQVGIKVKVLKAKTSQR